MNKNNSVIDNVHITKNHDENDINDKIDIVEKKIIDIDHLETKDTDPIIDFKCTSTSSSKDNYKQNNDDNSSMQKSISNFKMNLSPNEMIVISYITRSWNSKA